MKTSTNNIASINDAIQARTGDRNVKKYHPSNDKYSVKIKDEKGKDYELVYFFGKEGKF